MAPVNPNRLNEKKNLFEQILGKLIPLRWLFKWALISVPIHI